tara:strand:+ start:51 stop:854 length:804 start_codon:yes stop_codon:yes gene_type:complete
MLNIDLVSDLHIDQWDSSIPNKYPCGKIRDFPIDWSKIGEKNNILVVAGDISDNLDLSIQYLNEISQYYDRILFVDGNHEHVYKYPNLYSIEEIYTKIKQNRNKKIVYLPKEPYIENGIVFIGYCGWWDYFKSEKLMNEDMFYFRKWRGDLGPNDGINFMSNLINEGGRQIKLLTDLILKYEKDDTINKIVLVTHTVPKKEYAKNLRIEVNSDYKNLFNISSKLKYWLFGHTHQQMDKNEEIRFISNPRGRPEDYNREQYNLKKITL